MGLCSSGTIHTGKKVIYTINTGGIFLKKHLMTGRLIMNSDEPNVQVFDST